MSRYCFIGLDTGRCTIYACAVDENGEKILSKSLGQTHCGYEQLLTSILKLQADGLTPIVSAEGHDGNIGPLDEYLLSEGIGFKPLHPTAVSRYKAVLGQPHKTDAYDAYVIAELLRNLHQRIDQKVAEGQTTELKSLSRTYKSLTKAKTRFANQLQQELISYFPELLTQPVFSSITGHAALNLLIEYPTPGQIASLSADELTQFLSHHSKNHLGEETAKRLIDLAQTVGRSPAALESKGLIVSFLASTIVTMTQNLSQLKKQMRQISKPSQSLQRLISIPGVSVRLAARLIGELQTLDRFASEAKLAMFVGTAPVADDSGKRSGHHKTTHRVNKVKKDAIMQIALCNWRVSDISINYYQAKRKAGKSHWHKVFSPAVSQSHLCDVSQPDPLPTRRGNFIRNGGDI